MTNWSDMENKRRQGGLWSLIGLMSFGLLGILLGAALVYGLFTYYLYPGELAWPFNNDEAVIEPGVPEEPAQPLPEDDTKIDMAAETELVDVVEKIIPAIVGVNNQVVVEQFGDDLTVDLESGSGVVISPDGYIVTNQHVIVGAEKVMILFDDQTYFEASVVGEDVLTDLALLKVDATDLAYISLGNSEEILVGQEVLAIGNPLGFQQTVTAGIVSAVGRQVRVPGSEYAYTFIQTDATINPGNSGGPLVNINGDIIGINTAKVSLVGVEGIGFSIPSNIVTRVVEDLKNYGKVPRPHLGVLLEDWVDYSETATRRGIKIVEIAEGSPADEAGLISGDVIVAVGGKHVHYFAQLFDRLFDYYPGDSVELSILRNDQEETVTIVPDERPERHPLED